MGFFVYGMMGSFGYEKIFIIPIIMKTTLILRIIGMLHIFVGILLFVLILMPNEIAANIFGAPSNAIMIWFKTPMTVVASMNLGLGILLIISSSMNDYKSKKYVLLGEIGMMVCILFGALFNQFSTFTATGPPAPLWAMIIFNLFFSIYGYYKGE